MGSVHAKVKPISPVSAVVTSVKPSVPPKKKSHIEANPTLRSTRDCSLSPGSIGYADLPPVSMFHPGGAAPQPKDRRLAYGELTPDEIATILQLRQRPAASKFGSSQIPPATQTVAYAASDDGSADMYDADSDSVSVHPFIDDAAEEHNGSSDAASSSDGKGYDSPSPSTVVHDVPIAPLSSLPDSPECTKVCTEKGRYVNALLADGHISDLAGGDSIRDVPNATGSPAAVTCCNAGAVLPTAASPSHGSTSTYVFASAIAVQATSTPPKAKILAHHCPPFASTRPAVEGSTLSSSVIKTLVVQKPINVPAGSSPSSVQVEDLTGIDNTPPSTKHARVVAVKALPPAKTPMGNGNFFAMLDALIGDYCRDHKSEPENVEDAATESQQAISSSVKPPPASFKEPDDVTLHVMQPELQESQLVPLYEKMPSIGEFRAVVSLGQDPNTFEHPTCVTYDEIVLFFSHDTLRSFISYMQFTGHGPYCNLTTLLPTAFISDGRKALYASCTAVAMMVGMVMACHLYQPAWEGGYEIQDPLGISDTYIKGGMVYHSITVMPFRQLWHHKSTMLSSIFKLPYMQCSSMMSNGPEFTTCSNVTHEDGLANKNKLPSPAQRKDPASANRSLNRLSSAGKDYWHCLGFEDDVPIFDGRASKKHHFLFRPGDFDKLSSLPRYTPSCDLDYFTLVAVDYMPAVWSVKKHPRLNMNVQFVIVLGQAPNTAELANAGYMG
ncbi:hypothetical protein EDD18DRAFT_1357512 [Armillaria luteobubalina]|uniref:Uncharacterized protein n=1 Tax=Armillaria luteobubalina TaxID=153913 RepID=A0AA39PZT8_9AGAR|nr:hypothetical protein EDD18DRAFT_1357512 [Armillaria luteobubalina]